MVSPAGLIEYIANNLVSETSAVQVDYLPGNDEDVIELRVDESDLGKVIGKGGSVVRSMRVLLSAVGLRDEKNYLLEIID